MSGAAQARFFHGARPELPAAGLEDIQGRQ